jgi:UDP-N-acetylmuramoyl-tripeptide--D-alanyl-D-alanine ligase
MAVRFSDEQVVQATGGRKVRAGARAYYLEVCTDSRKLSEGSLFVALQGERFDAHAFVPEVAKAGAAGAVVKRGVALGELPADFALFEVDDTLAALGGLARYHRCRFKGRVVAVGGSNGKTTTKELVGGILAAAGPSLKTEGNLNNEVGVPLTLFRLGPQHQSAVIEMGMNHPGEMARLTAMTLPDAGLLTVIQAEHLEGLKDLDGVAEAEGELFRGLRKEATAVVNLDDPRIVAQARQSGSQKLSFGKARHADVQLRALEERGREGLLLTLVVLGTEHRVRLSLLGEHNALNAAGAFAAGLAIGIDPSVCVQGLETARAHPRRLNALEGVGGITVLDDCYNANPGSMLAALASLRALSKGGRAQAVLGDMLELGTGEDAAHAELGAEAAQGVSRVAFFGPRSKTAYARATEAGATAAHFTDVPELLAWLREDLREGDVVLVKGSRGMRMERVVEALTGHESDGAH